MALQDPDPERRNLTVLSLSIIIYYIAGGTITGDDSVKLPMVNVHFTNAGIFTWVVWVSWLWLLYRYWVTHHGLLTKEFRTSCASHISCRILRKYVNEAFIARGNSDISIERNPEVMGYHISAMETREHGKQLTVFRGSVKSRNPETGQVSEFTPYSSLGSKIEPIKLDGVEGKYTLLKYYIYCGIFTPVFSNYIPAYILSVSAPVIAIIYNWSNIYNWAASLITPIFNAAYNWGASWFA